MNGTQPLHEIAKYRQTYVPYSDRDMLIALYVEVTNLKEDSKGVKARQDEHDKQINKNTKLIGAFFLALTVVTTVGGFVWLVGG